VKVSKAKVISVPPALVPRSGVILSSLGVEVYRYWNEEDDVACTSSEFFT
jgi:hypothetical protein